MALLGFIKNLRTANPNPKWVTFSEYNCSSTVMHESGNIHLVK